MSCLLCVTDTVLCLRASCPAPEIAYDDLDFPEVDELGHPIDEDEDMQTGSETEEEWDPVWSDIEAVEVEDTFYCDVCGM